MIYSIIDGGLPVDRLSLTARLSPRIEQALTVALLKPNILYCIVLIVVSSYPDGKRRECVYICMCVLKVGMFITNTTRPTVVVAVAIK